MSSRSVIGVVAAAAVITCLPLNAGAQTADQTLPTSRVVSRLDLLSRSLLLYRMTGLETSYQDRGQSTVTGISRALNPALSVNGLFLAASLFGEGPEEELTGAAGEQGRDGIAEGLHLQEAEIRLTSFVDPYFKGDIIIGFGDEGAEIEEAFIASQELPFGWTARFGKTYAPFGKQNELHTHQFPFVETPLINTHLFGAEGLGEFGAELSYLIPTPFFMQATAAVYNGDNLFFAPDSLEALASMGRLSALWDLSESTTLEVGGSMLVGRSGWARRYENVRAADLTLKWRPLRRSLYTQAEWQVEYLRASRLPEEGGEGTFGGLTSHVRYRFDRTWWISGRFERTGLPGEEQEAANRFALQLAWVPGEFELWRLQYSLTRPADSSADPFSALYLQMTFTIGSHPAHKY